MDGVDKAELLVGGRRMIDRLIDRLTPQAGTIVIAGNDDRDTGLPVIPDDPAGPKGPAAALFSVGNWLQRNTPDADGFITAPVDAPLLPDDLVLKLASANGCAFADDGARKHPTIAYWRMSSLQRAFAQVDEENPSLHRLADLCQAQGVMFHPEQLTNINSPADLETFTRLHNDEPA